MFGRFLKKSARPAPAPAAERTQPLVAIVDDDEDLCRMLELALREAGYATETAHDGQSGLELVTRTMPDVLLLDIKMPRMNGYQVLTRLHQDPAMAALPVVVITNVDEERQFSEEEWARRLEVRRFLAKPFEVERVLGAVAELLRRSEGDATDPL